MISFNGLKLQNRYIIASGPAKYGRGYYWHENPYSAFLFKLGYLVPEWFGAVVTKTITLEPRQGNYRFYKPWQVLRKINNGWANRFGWNNCGIHEFRDNVWPRTELNNLIISIGAVKKFTEILLMVSMLNRLEIKAIELNISCPHVDLCHRNDLPEIKTLLLAIAKQSRHPLILKLGAGSDLVAKATLAEDCGLNAVCVINTVSDKINNFGACGISGPIIKKYGLEAVSTLSKKIKIPIIGGGGINSLADCRDYFDAGAQAVFFSSFFLPRTNIFAHLKEIKKINQALIA